MRLEPGGLRGASLWERDGPPFILVNREDIETATGRIFTLLHEYAHLLVRRSGITCDFRGQDALGDVEKFANAFAAEAILPREELVQRLHELGYHERRDVWSDSALDKIREPFHASRDTVAILIEDLGLAPPGHYWQRRAEWDRRIPFGRRGPGPSISLTKRERVRNQFGGNTLRVFALGQGQGLLTKADTSEILGMKVEDAEELLTGSTA
jgi:Zn-dependent peptidase ImmA (M78 family)